MNKIRNMLKHLQLSLALASAVLLILHYYNPKLGFVTSPYSLIVLFLFAILTVVNTVADICNPK